jgi:hypothetical protein
MAMTLAEALKLEDKPLRRGVISTLLEESYLMQIIPWETIGALSTTVIRIKSLPSVGFRAANEGYAESTGSVDQLSESVYPFGGDIDVDKIYVRNRANIEEPRALQTRLKLKAAAYEFQDYFINGDQAVNPKGFDGIKKRISNLAPSQTIDAFSLDLSGDPTTANMNKFVDLLDQLIYSIEGHRPDVLLMNDQMLLKIWSVLRRLNLLNTAQDMFGREIFSYKGVRLIDVGVKADQTTKIIPTTSGNTDIYAVRFGSEEFVGGIQEYEMDVQDLGELQEKPVYRLRIDWPIGIAMWHPRSAAVLKNVKVA